MSGSKHSFDLSAKKRAVLETLLRKEGVEAKTERIPRRKVSGPVPLSFAQQRLWFFDQFEPLNPAYNLTSAISLKGRLNVAALEKSFNEVVRRHEALRTTFDFRDGQPVQIITAAQPVRLHIVDLSRPQTDGRNDSLESLIREESLRPFNLKRGPLLRVTLARLKDDEHVLALAMHHIVSDAWSMGVFVREMATLYEGYSEGKPAPLEELPIQYADFAVWQRQWLQGGVLEQQLSYWKKQLGGDLPVLELPADRPRPAVQTYNGTRINFPISDALGESLRALSQAEGATLFMTLLAAYMALLYRYTGQEDMVVGTPIANRNRADIESLIGFFTNTLVMRADLSGNPTFRELLARAREVALDAYAHQDLPFEYLVEKLHPERDLSHSPLTQVVFVMQNIPKSAIELSNLSVKPLEGEVKTAKFDLTLYIDDTGRELEGTLEYNTDLFNRDTITRMIGHFQTLLKAVAANPAERIADLPLLAESEKRQLLIDWNATRSEYPQDQCAHHLFEAQVERTPDAAAVLFENEQLTYRELNAQANRLAHHLRSLGVNTGDLVGIFMERSLEMIVGLLGVLKAGAACLPLDPSYPKARLGFMLEDAQAKVVLSQPSLAESFAEQSARVVCLDDLSSIAQASDSNPRAAVTPENWVYVIYTSGSTGKPKGVAMPHCALVNLAEWHHVSPLKSESTLQFASLNFDVSFQEMFSTWHAGGTLILIRDSARADIPALGRLIEQINAQRFHLPVVVLQKLAEEFCDKPHVLASLREMMVGGEQLQITEPIIELFSQLKDCVLYNHYGPSESHVVTSYQLPEDPASWPALPPLGRPIANTEIYLLDSYLHPVPINVPGELYIGGACLAHGYMNRPELTAAAFTPNPFGSEPGTRLYKTGDVARFLPDGQIEFLSRNDFQIKIRGFRIELGEIEVALRHHPSIKDAAVVARLDEKNDKRLVAYVVAVDQVSSKQLRDYLKAKLPEYMLPAVFVMIDEMPLTASGKIDRLRLPDPKPTGERQSHVEPRTALERVIAGIWGEVLGVERVGVDEDFFELGGHSLIATQVASRVRDVLGAELALRKMFEEPTVEGVARVLVEDERERIERVAEVVMRLSELSDDQAQSLIEENAGKADEIARLLTQPQAQKHALLEALLREEGVETRAERIPRREQAGPVPLSFAQQRLWFLDQYEPGNTFYNIPAALRLKGSLNISALEQSLNEIIRRHEALRTTFAIADGHPAQAINEPTDFKLPLINLQHLPQLAREQKAKRMAAREAECPFDLAAGPMIRARLLRLAEDDHVLLLIMHHIVSDGWSMGVLIREIGALYDGYSAGKPSPLEELPIQYADFAVWQHEWLQGAELERQLDYWKRQLEGSPSALELPTDRPRPTFKTYYGADVPLELPKKLSDEIADLSRREGVTLFMTLLAAFDVLLHHYSDQEEILVGAPIANRNRAEIEGLIGFFVNTLVMRADLSGDPSFGELLSRVREVTLGAYAHQDLPFERLVEELQPERNLSHSPLFQVIFHLQNALVDTLKLSGITLSQLNIENKTAKFDLSLAMAESEEGLIGRFNYNTDMFDAMTIERMAEHFQILLEAAVANPDERISRLPLMSEAESRRMLIEWNDTRSDYGKDRLVHEAFAEQAKLRPDAIAVRFEQTSLTYEQLDRKANQLANYLQRSGVGPEAVVGICLERSLEMMVGLFGILKAGGAYLPLDPEHPKERLAFMLEDSRVKVLLSQNRLLEQFPSQQSRIICLDSDWEMIGQESSEAPDTAVGPDNLAYIIYTSGSTGKPKGIMIEHKNLANYLGWINVFMLDDTVQAVPAVQNLGFDGSLKQIFAPLLRGTEVWLFSKDVVSEPARLIEALSARRALRFSCVPSLWKAVLDTIKSGQAALAGDSITHLFVGGEPLSKSVVDRSFALLPRLRMWNFYGPSEITVAACAARINPEDKITIGRPIAGKRAYILDSRLQPVPIGVPGELYIGGSGPARGYAGRPDLTAESFIPNSFSDEPGARFYKSGDLARYLPDGRIEFLGRMDHQVKVRGFRIELGEVEAALRQHPKVQDAVATTQVDAQGDNYLVAYVVANESQAPTVAELRAFLREKLPDYMIPSVYVMMDRLPLTPNGKIDRRALPEPDRARREQESTFVAPHNAVEEAIASIFSEVLGVAPVGADDNFFNLGGHSLLATQVMSRVRKTFQVDLPLRRLFESPTVAALAQLVIASEAEHGQAERIATLMKKIESLSTDEVEDLLSGKQKGAE